MTIETSYDFKYQYVLNLKRPHVEVFRPSLVTFYPILIYSYIPMFLNYLILQFFHQRWQPVLSMSVPNVWRRIEHDPQHNDHFLKFEKPHEESWLHWHRQYWSYEFEPSAHPGKKAMNKKIIFTRRIGPNIHS